MRVGTWTCDRSTIEAMNSSTDGNDGSVEAIFSDGDSGGVGN